MKTLERRLGLWSVVAISIGAMLGSGLFVLPGLAVLKTGPSVWLAYVVAGICVLPATLSKAELATAMPVSGGSYVYIDRAFGPLVGTIAGVGLWLSLLLKSSFALVGFGAYLHVFADVPLKIVGLAMLSVVIALNIVGVRKVGKVQVAVVAIAIVGLSVLTVWGFTTFDARLLSPSFPGGSSGVLTAAAMVYISYAGVTKIAAVAEEVRDPGRNLPRGMLISLVVVGSLYVLVTLVLVGNVPSHTLGGDLRPIYTLANAVAGPSIGIAAAVLGVLTMSSMANAGLLAASRFPFAMSRDNLLPGAIGWVHSRLMTPVVAILLTGAMMAVALLFLDVYRIAKLASAFMLIAFATENLAVIVLRESDARWYQPAFRSPLYPFTQIFGIVSSLVLLAVLGILGIAAIAFMFVPGFVLFTAYGRKRTERTGVLGRLGPRRDMVAEAARRSRDLPTVLPGDAAVVVPLFGRERSPETLVEVSAALADGHRIEVVHLSDIPEQIGLGDMLEEGAGVAALRRRLSALGREHSLDVKFDALVTRDVVRTINDFSARVHCDWLLMEWHGRTERGVSMASPIGWLIDHLACNLALYKDAGVHEVRSVLTFPAPGPHDSLVVTTADRLAQSYGATLTLVRFAPDDAPAQLVDGERDYLAQLAQLCTVPPGLEVVRGKHAVKAITTLAGEFDLLVMGSTGKTRLRDLLLGGPDERITRGAPCSVMRIKTPPGQSHEIATRHPTSQPGGLISSYLDERCVVARIDAANKNALFPHFARSLAITVPGVDAKRIEEVLWQREHTQNTAVGEGVAIPHANVAEADRAYLGVFTTASPLDYDAPDNQPIDVFFVTLGPPSARNVHLELLAGVSRLVLQTDLLERLRAAEDAAAIVNAVTTCESQLESTS